MNCRKCQAEMEEGVTLCPVCGEDHTQDEIRPADLHEEEIPEHMEEMPCEHMVETTGEHTEQEDDEVPAEEPKKTKKSGWKVGVAVACCVVLLAALALGVFYGINGGFQLKENNILYKESYTVNAEKAQAAADRVVATYGEYELTNSQLQAYYWMSVVDFLNEYYYYASMMGLDYTQPLDTQMYSQAEGLTWQHYFLETAFSTWRSYQMLAHMAAENEFQLTDQMQEFFDTLPENLATMAANYGYDSADAMVQELYFGTGSSYQDYEDYMRLYYTGFLYFSDEYGKINPTDEEIEFYYDTNITMFEDAGLTKESGSMVDVRHILIKVEGTTDADGNTTYSDDQWEACRAEAQAILDQWLAGDKTEETFAELANSSSEDGGSNTNGGLYEDVVLGEMVEEFEAWCFDESRQYGDYDLVKTPYGYHVMFFVASDEQWYVYAKSNLISDTMNEQMEEATADMEMKINYKNIALGELDLG